MTFPFDLMSLSSPEGARRVALILLDRAHDAAARWHDPQDAQALHGFRVALRRLRSTLRAWQPQLKRSVRGKDRRKLREIQERTGAGRDAEVGLTWLARHAKSTEPALDAGRLWIAERLEQRLEKSLERTRTRALRHFEALEHDLRPRLEALRMTVNLAHPLAGERFGDVWAALIHEHVAELTERLAEVVSPSNCEQAHDARIRLKRLRYLAEPAEDCVDGVKELIADCKRLQDSLGELNDAHVLGAEIDDALDGIDQDERAAHLALARSGLVELAVRVTARREQLFVELERDWLGVGKNPIAAGAPIVADAALDAAHAGVEIERKYLLSRLPPLPGEVSLREVEQGWLPGKTLRERVRCVRDEQGARFFRTLKLGRGISRVEIEEETTREIFDALWPLTDGCRVRKRRYVVKDGEFVWEIDDFQGRELRLAEVELHDPAAVVVPPTWLAPCIVREVTDEAGYTNLELAT